MNSNYFWKITTRKKIMKKAKIYRWKNELQGTQKVYGKTDKISL